MQVTVSLAGRAHGFDLARELHGRGALRQLTTSYPRFSAVQSGVPADRVRSLLWQELIARAWRQSPAALRRRWDANPWLSDVFDTAAARAIPEDTDVFIGWTTKALEGLRRARGLGAVAIVDRANSHERHVQRVMEEEYRRFAPDHYRVPQGLVDKASEECESADYVLVPSTFAERTMVAEGLPAAKILRVPLGVNLSLFREVPKQDSTFRVVYVGSMQLRKGVQYLLRAFHELALPKAELWLIGSLTEGVKRLFAQYAGSFRYWGHIPHVELHRYLCQCNLFALCSVEDGFGMVLSQAMACGRPVLCTQSTAGPDLIEEGRQGFVIPIRDVEAIKEKILWCYQNQAACWEMGQQAKRRVCGQLTWEDYGSQIHTALEQVLAKRRGATQLATR